MTFSSKAVYITGASSGLGRELALQLGAQGAKLALFARRTELLDSLVGELSARGVKARAYALDVADRDAVQARFNEAESDVGPCDVLIANAGIGLPTSARKLDARKVMQVWDVNVKGAFYCIEAVLPAMLARKSGQLVGVSSIAAYGSFPGSWAYCSSKSALSALLEGLRRELLTAGIAVTTLCPGFIKTEMTKDNKFKMPFMLDCDVAVRRMIRAIEHKKKVYAFPKRTYALVRMTRFLPDRMLAGVTKR
jgi:short-subunit dehydrogenase